MTLEPVSAYTWTAFSNWTQSIKIKEWSKNSGGHCSLFNFEMNNSKMDYDIPETYQAMLWFSSENII